MLAVAPVSAGDHSPWLYRSSPPTLAIVAVAERQDARCRHCTEGHPCGNTGFSAKGKGKGPPTYAC